MAGQWKLNRDSLSVEFKEGYAGSRAIYAFVHKGHVKYVGICQGTNRTLAHRFKEYCKTEMPIVGQSISQNMRIKANIVEVLRLKNAVSIYALKPPKGLAFCGIEIDLVSGLEQSLIDLLKPSWNKRGRAKVRKTR